MRSTRTITLPLTADGVDRYCRELARRSPELNAAGIDAPEYLAMTDVCRYFGADV